MKHPKFDQALENKINNVKQQQSSSGYGVLLKYDPIMNTATVAMAAPGSDAMGELFNDVPCPVTLGVQGVAPTAGRPVWIDFKDNSNAYPVITHYFNHVYHDVDYMRQTQARSTIPRYMLAM